MYTFFVMTYQAESGAVMKRVSIACFKTEALVHADLQCQKISVKGSASAGKQVAQKRGRQGIGHFFQPTWQCF